MYEPYSTTFVVSNLEKVKKKKQKKIRKINTLLPIATTTNNTAVLQYNLPS